MLRSAEATSPQKPTTIEAPAGVLRAFGTIYQDKSAAPRQELQTGIATLQRVLTEEPDQRALTRITEGHTRFIDTINVFIHTDTAYIPDPLGQGELTIQTREEPPTPADFQGEVAGENAQLLAKAITHELRTPLTVEKGFAEMLARRHPSPEVQEATGQIVHAVGVLSNDILQIEAARAIEATAAEGVVTLRWKNERPSLSARLRRLHHNVLRRFGNAGFLNQPMLNQ